MKNLDKRLEGLGVFSWGYMRDESFIEEFGEGDFEGLIEYAVSADKDDKAIDKALHSWKILAQHKVEKAAKPLVKCLKQFSDEEIYGDYSSELLPRVLYKMGGVDVVGDVLSFFKEDTIDECLFYIISAIISYYTNKGVNAKERDLIKEVYFAYFKKGTGSLLEYGFMVSDLLSLHKAYPLQAKEIESIRELYKKELADEAVCGDLIEIESVLGLRKPYETRRSLFYNDDKKEELTELLGFLDHNDEIGKQTNDKILKTFQEKGGDGIIELTIEYLNKETAAKNITISFYLIDILVNLRIFKAVDILLRYFNEGDNIKIFDEEEYPRYIEESLIKMGGLNSVDIFLKYLDKDLSKPCVIMLICEILTEFIKDEVGGEELANKIKRKSCEFIEKSNSKFYEENGFVISLLLDIHQKYKLGAAEIEIMRDAYKKEIVAYKFIGDLEELEINLGVREKRETAKKNFILADLAQEEGISYEECAASFGGEKEFAKKLLNYTKENSRNEEYLEPIRVDQIGRNDSCPCGSGKKYKKCCLEI